MAYRRDTMGAGQQETASGWNERENLRREKMDIEDRAKQFMPFDALKGFKEICYCSESIYRRETGEWHCIICSRFWLLQSE